MFWRAPKAAGNKPDALQTLEKTRRWKWLNFLRSLWSQAATTPPSFLCLARFHSAKARAEAAVAKPAFRISPVFELRQPACTSVPKFTGINKFPEESGA